MAACTGVQCGDLHTDRLLAGIQWGVGGSLYPRGPQEAELNVHDGRQLPNHTQGV